MTKQTKRILYISQRSLQDDDGFFDPIMTAHGSVTFDRVHLEDLLFSVIDGQADIYNQVRRASLSVYTTIFTLVGHKAGDFAAALTVFAGQHSIRLINQSDLMQPYFGKLSQMFMFASQGLPVPDTFAIYGDNRLQQWLLAQKRLEYPFILKSNVGIQGKDNHLITTPKQLRATMGQRQGVAYVAQQFILNDGDYRVLFMGFNNPPLIFKRSAVDGSHLNNLSQGATATGIDVKDADPHMLDIAQRAATLTGRELTGVDIVSDPTGKFFLLETNDTPAFRGGFNIPQKRAMFRRFMGEL